MSLPIPIAPGNPVVVTVDGPAPRERRLHVRVRPAPDLPAFVRTVGPPDDSPLARASLSVVDVSVGGLAVLRAGGAPPSIGDELPLELLLPNRPPLSARAEVRYDRDEGVFGVAFVEPGDDLKRALRWYVGELFERGHSA